MNMRSTLKCPNPTNTHMSQASFRKKPNSPYLTVCYHPSEEWLPITYIPNLQDWYYVSSYGKIYSKYFDTLIRPRFLGHGYHEVTLRYKDNRACDQLVHRLVLSTFNPVQNMNELQVNHINGIKTDNRIDNLEWCTCEYNILHAHMMGLYDNTIGEQASFSTFTNDQVHKMCQLFEQNIPIDEVCKILRLENNYKNYSKMYNILTHRAWKHISCHYNF